MWVLGRVLWTTLRCDSEGVRGRHVDGEETIWPKGLGSTKSSVMKLTQ